MTKRQSDVDGGVLAAVSSLTEMMFVRIYMAGRAWSYSGHRSFSVKHSGTTTYLLSCRRDEVLDVSLGVLLSALRREYEWCGSNTRGYMTAR
jgi:hypothetical protein